MIKEIFFINVGFAFLDNLHVIVSFSIELRLQV